MTNFTRLQLRMMELSLVWWHAPVIQEETVGLRSQASLGKSRDTLAEKKKKKKLNAKRLRCG
jgi:hypothetical protein